MAMAKDKPITEAGLKSVLRDVIAQEANEGGSISQAVGRVIAKEATKGGSIFKAVEDGVTSVGVVTEKTIEGFRKEVNQRFDKHGADLQIIKDDVSDCLKSIKHGPNV